MSWAVVFMLVSVACAILGVLSVPVAASSATLLVSTAGLLCALIAEICFERFARARSTLIGMVAAVLAGLLAVMSLFEIGSLTSALLPDDFWARRVSVGNAGYIAWTRLGGWLAGMWLVACAMLVAASGLVAGNFLRGMQKI